jgi:hypothetical protein
VWLVSDTGSVGFAMQPFFCYARIPAHSGCCQMCLSSCLIAVLALKMSVFWHAMFVRLPCADPYTHSVAGVRCVPLVLCWRPARASVYYVGCCFTLDAGEIHLTTSSVPQGLPFLVLSMLRILRLPGLQTYRGARTPSIKASKRRHTKGKKECP